MAGGLCVSAGRWVFLLVSRPLPQVPSQDVFWPTGNRNPVPWLTLTTWESGDWLLPSPKLVDLCESRAS